MSTTGRYFVVDLASGRRFCVEPIGLQRTGYGPSLDEFCTGSIRERESIITPDRFVNIGYTPSPRDYIAGLLAAST